MSGRRKSLQAEKYADELATDDVFFLRSYAGGGGWRWRGPYRVTSLENGLASTIVRVNVTRPNGKPSQLQFFRENRVRVYAPEE